VELKTSFIQFIQQLFWFNQTFFFGGQMSAIERYYSTLPLNGPYYAGDDEDEFAPMSDEEIAAAYEFAMQDF
jgi:hypothetical protein